MITPKLGQIVQFGKKQWMIDKTAIPQFRFQGELAVSSTYHLLELVEVSIRQGDDFVSCLSFVDFTGIDSQWTIQWAKSDERGDQHGGSYHSKHDSEGTRNGACQEKNTDEDCDG